MSTIKKKGSVKTKLVKLPKVQEINPFEIPVDIVADSDMFIPVYQTPGAVCVDLVANVPSNVHGMSRCTITSRTVVKIDCGFSMAIPPGYKCEIVLRSGHSDRGLIVTNAPGQIDFDYRGRVGVNLGNVGHEIIVIDHGERFAQMFITPVYHIRWNRKGSVEDLGVTQRNNGGFGSTGKNT